MRYNSVINQLLQPYSFMFLASIDKQEHVEASQVALLHNVLFLGPEEAQFEV